MTDDDEGIGVCPNCGDVTRPSATRRHINVPHSDLAICVRVLRVKLEEVIDRLDNHRLY